MRDRIEITVRFTVNAEIVPGMFYDPLDFARFTCDDIKRRLQSYNPEIEETKVYNRRIDKLF